MKTSIFCLSILFFTCLFPLFGQMNLATGMPEIRNYSPSEYDAHGQNWCVVQDDRGLMYFGNGNGLLEFDGNNWRLVKTLKNVVVHSLAVANNGSVSYGSFDEFGFIAPDKTGNWKYHDYFSEYNLQKLNFDDINNIAITNEAVYYQGIFGIFIKKKEDYAILMAGKNDVFLYSVCLNNSVFVSSRVHGLSVVEGDILKPVLGGERFANDAIKFIVPYKDKRYLIYSAKQDFVVFDPSNRVNPFSEAIEFDELVRYLQMGSIRCCTKTKDGKYLFGTTRNGIIICNNDGKPLKEINQSNGLPTNTVLGLGLDKQENVWLALDNGISYIVLNSPFTFINKSQGITDYGLTVAVNRSVKGTTDNLYVGLPSGLFYSTGNDFNSRFKKSNTPLHFVTNLVNLYNVNYFLASSRIYQISDTIISPVLNTSDASASLKKMVFHHGYTLLGDMGIKILNAKKGKLIVEKELSGYTNSCLVLEEEDAIHLWEGRAGVPPERITIDFENDTVTAVKTYGIETGLPSTNYVLPQRLGNELIFLTEKGVYLFNSETDRFYPHPINKLLKLGKISSIAKDVDGNYFVVEDRVTKMLANKGNGHFILIDKPFRKIRKNGIGDIFPIQIKTNGIENNTVFLSYENGFINFNPELKDSCYKPFETLIRKVTARSDNDSIDQLFNGNFSNIDNAVSNAQSSELIPALAYSNNAIKFEYSACYYEQPEENEYSVFLEGYDNDWGEWSKEKQKEYNNLFEGNYTFKIRSRNIYGTLGNDAQYNFRVIPPRYRTTVAHFIYIILSIGFIYWVVRFYNRKLIKDKQQLEVIVSERTEEIVSQKEEIETQAEMLKDANEQLLKLNDFKESLTSMIVHDLKNPLNTIINFSENSLNNDQGTIKQRNDIRYINSSGKQMLTMVHNLLDIQKSENSMLVPDLSVTSIGRIADEAVESVQFFLENNHIRLISEIDATIMVNVDRMLIGRVFVNLLVNATKFTHVNGTIDIRSEIIRSHDAQIPDFVRILISDNGCGIEPEMIDRIFEKYISSGNNNNRKHHSSGLGLPFCKVAIEAHGGKIGATSELNIGTTIWFTLDIATYSTLASTINVEKDFGVYDIEFTDEEIAYLLPIAKQLEQISFYQITPIKEILSQVDHHTDNSSKWCIGVEKAAFASNKKIYTRLIKLVLTEINN